MEIIPAIQVLGHLEQVRVASGDRFDKNKGFAAVGIFDARGSK